MLSLLGRMKEKKKRKLPSTAPVPPKKKERSFLLPSGREVKEKRKREACSLTVPLQGPAPGKKRKNRIHGSARK